MSLKNIPEMTNNSSAKESFPPNSKVIPCFPDYSVDKQGNVFSLRCRRLRKLKSGKAGAGYSVVHLFNENGPKVFYVHHLVMEAFVGPRPVGYQVNHLNGLKTDNRLSNLEYVTASENMKHAYRLGLARVDAKGVRNGRTKLNESQVHLMCLLTARRELKLREIAQIVGCDRQIPNTIRGGRNWQEIYQQYLS